MSAIDNVIEHFTESYELKSFEAVEWSLVIHVEPFTAKQVAQFTKMRDKQGVIEASVWLITEKALDKDKKKLFKPEDRMMMLNKASYPVIEEVGLKILNLAQGKDADGDGVSDEELVEDIKKD